MLGSELKIKTTSPRARVGRGICSTLSRRWGAGGTAKMRADWAFVSGVSLVPAYLKLIEEYKTEEWKRHGRELVGATPPVPGQVGQAQQSRGLQGEAIGVKQSCNRDRTIFRTVKVQRYCLCLRRT